MPPITFDIFHRDAATAARVGRVNTPHGGFDTPAFMPVGTQGTVKGLLPSLVAATGAQCILGNTYHLMLRPGGDLVERMGGLHQWGTWGSTSGGGPMLTDSGGFQVFSLGHLNRITEDGVTFKSHLNGDTIHLTPERSMHVQRQLGADIIMAFDDCPAAAERDQGSGTGDQGEAINASAPPASAPIPDPRSLIPDRLRRSCERTLRWLDRCVTAHHDSGADERQGLFGIVQGGTDLDLRAWCADRVTQFDLPGYAIGGVAVGESTADIRRVVEHTAPLLPEDRPRYLMGVGYERDIVAAVRAGVDMFDCVLPTRNGRNAVAFTRGGPMRLRNARFAEDARPIEEGCDCVACGGEGVGGLGAWELGATESTGAQAPKPLSPQHPSPQPPGFSRSYLRHLFQTGEMLGGVLVSLHNLRHFQRLVLDIRHAIRDNAWLAFARHWPVAELSAAEAASPAPTA